MECRFCQNELTREFVNLINSPPSNSFLTEQQLNEPEMFYPLRLFVCDKCFLVQIDEYKSSDEIFHQHYAYFSSYSSSWLEHSHKYVEMITKRIGLSNISFVIEIGSNDGYLLQYFLEKKIPCLGIDPSANSARVAREKGIKTVEDFFSIGLSRKLVQEGRRADLIVANNVFAHVPDINDFVAGLKLTLKKYGIITMEFPHLMCLIERNQFDTIYHEHLSYFSFCTVLQICRKHGLAIFDVEEIPTHGGSLRIYARHEENKYIGVTPNVMGLFEKESAEGMLELDYYMNFQEKANKVKYGLLSFLLKQKKEDKKIIGYGAAAKGNTLINYCGIKKDLVEFVVDASPHKQGNFLPASHIPVVSEEYIKKTKPDYVLILPWNIKGEITSQLTYIREWGGKFVVAVPEVKVW